ncbi:uncharacterized protein GGS22DRAFT_191406 [Annulohypoxylon maeteangense]|uniref:uncharacterized protein n=1 Tax=Annulohypoxylon maeteangense TaxID=1927788 RepID=UPI002008847D|nr:uncharacterized protein GGS22DRAFT_191406 [Annulohypoxylon maeteangense]KAI0882236.1 hypothetical protein GGS22DRAFT_191406 [Annulohypoxylon maeteangense]
MSGVIEAIGLISGALGIIQFGIDNFPQAKSVDSVVRITTGLDTPGGLNNAGGSLPDVRLFNEAGKFLGLKKDPGGIQDGGFADVTISHEGDSTQQPTYTLFTANSNAICIAYATITLPSQDKYSWVGDWGRQCGASWYYSHVYIGSTGITPDCMWIDSNNDQPQSGFQLHWPEFYVKKGDSLPADPKEQTDKINFFCSQQPAFKYYNFATDPDPTAISTWPITNPRSEPEISYGAPKYAESAKFRRGTQYPRQSSNTTNPQPNRLVISNSKHHTADGLCKSATSYGPDFVNTAAGSFCRMSDKKQFPVCSKTVTDNCFNTGSKQLIVNGLATRADAYTDILDWTE